MAVLLDGSRDGAQQQAMKEKRGKKRSRHSATAPAVAPSPASKRQRLPLDRDSDDDSSTSSSSASTSSGVSSSSHDASQPQRRPSVTSERRRKPSSDADGAGSSSATSAAAFRRGMFKVFVDEALTQRYRGTGDSARFNELVAQFRAFVPPSSNSSRHRPTSAASIVTGGEEEQQRKVAQLRHYLDALTQFTARLEPCHAPLVDAIIALPWAAMDAPLVRAYTRFTQSLLIARPQYLSQVLDSSIRGFRYHSSFTVSSLATTRSLTRRIAYARLHALLHALLRVIPTLSHALAAPLTAHAPSRREPRRSHVAYATNVLELARYCPAVAEHSLALVVERALAFDVEIHHDADDYEEEFSASDDDDDEDEAEDEEDEEQDEGSDDEDERAATKQWRKLDFDALLDRETAQDGASDSSDYDSGDESDEDDDFDLEDLDDVGGNDDGEPEPSAEEDDAMASARKRREAAALPPTSPEAIARYRESSAKLDAVLAVLLSHVADAHDAPVRGSRETTPTQKSVSFALRESGEVQAEDADSKEQRCALLSHSLLDIFDRAILRTFKSRHTQFLVFYLCARDPSAADTFVGSVLAKALAIGASSASDNSTPMVTRVAAAGYVASFVARASFVDRTMARRVVALMCSFLDRYTSAYSSASSQAVTARLSIYYAVAQAVFYVFCFRWRDLLDDDDEDVHVDGADDVDGIIDTGAGARRWMPELDAIKRAVVSPLCPLRICARPVAQQFADVALKKDFLYCHQLLPSTAADSLAPSSPEKKRDEPRRTLSADMMPFNRPGMPPHSVSAPHLPANAAKPTLELPPELDSFFPFDPLKLPVSASFIDGFYRSWTNDDEDDDDDDDDTSIDSDTVHDDSSSAAMSSDDEDMTARLGIPLANQEDDRDEVAKSLEAMSLSPDWSIDSAFRNRSMVAA